MNLLGRATALAVPLLLLAACGDATSSPSGADDPTSSPTPVTSSQASGSPEATEETSSAPTRPIGDGPVVLGFKGLAQGAPPAMPYLREDPDAPGGWSLVEQDGDVRPLDRSYAQFAPMGDGMVGLAYDNDTTVAYLLDGGLRDVSHVEAWSSISHGIVDSVPGVIHIGDVADDGGMLGMTSVADEDSCWGLFKVWKSRPKWETCDYTLFDFSPSGQRILAGPAYLDGFGQGFAAVLDREGKVLAEWHSEDQAAILGTTWEDEGHVLVSAFQNEKWAVIRVGLDGTVELALPPVPDPGAGGAYVLPVR